jgi:hypothetical protein
MNVTDEPEIADLDRADLARTDKAARQVCPECGGRGWHFTGCPEDVEQDEDESL